MGKAKRGKLSRRVRHDPVGLPPSPAGGAVDGGGAGAAGGGGGGGAKAERAHVLLQEVGSDEGRREMRWSMWCVIWVGWCCVGVGCGWLSSLPLHPTVHPSIHAPIIH